jgi:uncharacterized protein (DUF885 family)
MGMRRTLLLCLALATACRREAPAQPPAAADARVTALADAYLAGYFERNPDQVTVYGIPGHSHDRLPDNSLAAVQAWHAREDAWLTEARAIDPTTVKSESLRATNAIVREALEGAVGSRLCRTELWPVSQMAGWQTQFGYLVTIQPVKTAAARQQALARWGSLPRYLDVEIDNLREGARAGYTSPRHIVRIVIDQIDGLIKASAASGPVADSPFHSPSERDDDPAFKAEFDRLVTERLVPAFRKYRDFLANEYGPVSRETIGLSELPDGAACYDALVRQFSSLPMPAAEVYALGERQMNSLMAEMRTVAERSFKTTDVPALLKALRTERRYLFKDRADLIAYTKAAVERAKAAAPGWFGRLPSADVVIEPYPAYREKNGANEYNPPAEDGSRPGLFYISAYQAEKQSRAIAESTAFHETIPGHHLQSAIALERRDAHPIGRYIFNSGYAEGWGLYAERLADEMKLFSGDLDRLGMLGSQALRAARLVVDPGLHLRGWTRQQAIDYMLSHTAETPDYIASEIDRYTIWPAQATSYMLGGLEIRRAREEAEKRLGPAFSIKEFHDQVLEDGGVPLTFLAAKVRTWTNRGKPVNR